MAVGGKYGGLYRHLSGLPEQEWRVSFGEVESVIGAGLPPSARRHQVWWSNSASHTQAHAWLEAGWNTAEVDLQAETVCFKRTGIPSASSKEKRAMENTLDLLKELTGNPAMMWVVGGGSVVSENHAHGIKAPEVHNGWATIEADNWHFHLQLERIDGIQFVEAVSHGDLKSYYVRFSHDWDETLVRCYFPNPYLDDDEKRAPFQPEKLRVFEEARDRWVGKEDNLIFVQR